MAIIARLATPVTTVNEKDILSSFFFNTRSQRRIIRCLKFSADLDGYAFEPCVYSNWN